MKILTHEDIKKINIDPLESLTWVETVLKEKKTWLYRQKSVYLWKIMPFLIQCLHYCFRWEI